MVVGLSSFGSREPEVQILSPRPQFLNNASKLGEIPGLLFFVMISFYLPLCSIYVPRSARKPRPDRVLSSRITLIFTFFMSSSMSDNERIHILPYGVG